MEGCAFANFGNSSGTEGESHHKINWKIGVNKLLLALSDGSLEVLKISSSKITVVGKKNKKGKPSKGVEDFVLSCSCGEEKRKDGGIVGRFSGVENVVLCKLQLWGRKTKGGWPGKGFEISTLPNPFKVSRINYCISTFHLNVFLTHLGSMKFS